MDKQNTNNYYCNKKIRKHITLIQSHTNQLNLFVYTKVHTIVVHLYFYLFVSN
jgi:hypothetical protein